MLTNFFSQTLTWTLTFGDAAFLLLLVVLLAPVTAAYRASTRQIEAPRKEKPAPSEWRARLGLHDAPPGLFLAGSLLWSILLAVVFAGLIYALISLPFAIHRAAEGGDSQAARFALITITALAATLGAIVALPFTLLRTEVSRRQADHAELVLYNEKINAASDGLHAMRQITRDGETIHEADITRRNAAIDALAGLAEERPKETPRIARMLSVYVRELSAEYPAEDLPEEADPKALRAWARDLDVKRSDMESAVKTLGRLREVNDQIGPDEIDLSGANLQAMQLSQLNFDKARLSGARMEGAVLLQSRMEGAYLSAARMQGANLFEARMQGATLSLARMQGAHLVQARMQGANVFEALMEGADLSRARMQGARLVQARMQGANLFAARMQGADLSGVRMSEDTDLSNATLRGAAFRTVDDTTRAQFQPFLAEMFTGREGLTWPKYYSAWRAFQDTLPDFPEGWKVQLRD